MMEDTQRLTNYYIAKANDELRARLAQADQQIEWLSKENAALKRHAEEVTTGLLELRSVTSEALDTIRKRVAHDASEIEKWKELRLNAVIENGKLREYVKRDGAEVEKWRERYHQCALELAGTRNANFDFAKINADLRDRVALLEKALNSKPGTVYFGNEGFFLRGEDERP